MKWRKSSVLVCMAVLLAMPVSARALDMEMVYVGNAGNTGEQVRANTLGWGAVDYNFYIGKYEVTAGQYAEYLNATAKWDTLDLYGGILGDGNATYPHIIQSGTEGEGNYTYTVVEGYENRPINWISWGNAARFCNWLHNGKPTTGVQDATTTEDGAYTLNGNTGGQFYATVKRNAGALYFLPNANEWYKAAYHKNDGLPANYWEYPTRSAAAPTAVNNDPDLGNEATMRKPDSSYVDPTYYRTVVGDHENTYSAYGAFDMAGNVAEWTEKIKPYDQSDDDWYIKRQCLGGNYRAGAAFVDASLTSKYYVMSDGVSEGVGFRVASLVPEPGSVALLLMGCFGLTLYVWKRH